MIPEIIKGYVCPDYEDCSKCPYYTTDCIIFSKKGKSIAEEYEKLVEKNKQREEKK